jgi:hypothetical protein
MVVRTPPPGTATVVDLGEKTPRGSVFRLDGNRASQEPTHEHEHEHDEHGHEKGQDYHGGDSDEEPSFGVAL